MINLLKAIFGSRPAPAPKRPKSDKPPLPESAFEEFRDWLVGKRKQAVAFIPDEDMPVPDIGSRIGGPAWLPPGEKWPTDADGNHLIHLAQIAMSDVASLPDFPREGLLQYFIGADDMFGMNLDDLQNGKFLVRHIVPDNGYALTAQPDLIIDDGEYIEDYSPLSDSWRKNGVAMKTEAFEDSADWSLYDVGNRLRPLEEKYDTGLIEDLLESEEQERKMEHHVGGFPAFTQSDFRWEERYRQFDVVLLRLTSDVDIMWGDCGEAVFMISSNDLKAGRFDKAVYHWDCC